MQSKVIEDAKAIQALIDLLPVAVFVKDASSYIVLMNRACEEVLGISFTDVGSAECNISYPPNQITNSAEVDREIFRIGQQYESEGPFWNASMQQMRVGRTIKKPYYDAEGNPLYLLCSTVDITEMTASSKAHAQSEEKFRTMFDSSPLGMALNRMDGSFLEVNQSFLDIVGYQRKELQQLSYWHLTPDKYAKKEMAQLKSLLEKSQYGPYEKEYVTASGAVVPVRLNGVKINIGNESFIWSIIEDISEYRRIESALRIVATAFEAQVGIMITDADSIILRVNSTFTQQSGYSNEELVGQTPRILKSNLHDQFFYEAMWREIWKTGTWEGEIWDRRKSGEIYPKWMTIKQVKDASGTVTHYVGTQSDISARKQDEEKIHQLIYFDPLSGLPNRYMLIEKLEQVIKASSKSRHHGALVLLDVDNFQQLNDTQGHHSGDMLIQEIARRLQAFANDHVTIARAGGDEFVIMLQNIGVNQDIAATHAQRLSEKIIESVSQVFVLDGVEYYVTVSVGITIFQGNVHHHQQLLTQADVAMYAAKRAGKNTHRFFDTQMQVALEERARLESSLRHAMAKKQFILFYQPQVNATGTVTGVEALIRWNHPELGLISPAQFIPLAEETHMILSIGNWVLETACSQLSSWQSSASNCHLSIAVNISPIQFRQSDFVENLLEIVRETNVSPTKLKLELTENVIVGDLEEAVSKMTALKELGFVLSMDDFGTGYSSLNYLRQLPFDQLKIDRSFIVNAHENLLDAYMIEMIANMGAKFGVDIIAEGIETLAQYQYLVSLGCTGFQGYFFGKPMPADEFTETILTH